MKEQSNPSIMNSVAVGNISFSLAGLCFSKDRPLQLDGYIRSVERFFARGKFRLYVLYCATSEKYESAYEKLKKQYSRVVFIRERDFRDDVRGWLEKISASHVFFGVDDWIYRREVDIKTIEKAFKENNLTGFSLRLGREITYSGMCRVPVPRPEFIKENPYLLWDWVSGNGRLDWAYPFEICATVYARDYVIGLIELLDSGQVEHPNWPGMKSREWGHPSRFEALACTIARDDKNKPSRLMAAFPKAPGSLVTVNRVQDECTNFVYSGAAEMSAGELLKLWSAGRYMDINAYSEKFYNSIHIGDFILSSPDQKDTPKPEEYNMYAVMLNDMIARLREKKSPVPGHPLFIEFMKNYKKYFSMPGAEKHRVTITPAFAPEEYDEYKRRRDEWAFGRLEKFAPADVVFLGFGDEIALEIAKKRYLKYFGPLKKLPGNDHISFYRRNVFSLPVPDSSLRCLISFSFIEKAGLGVFNENLAPDGSWKALKEVNRAVSGGGHFISALPVSRDSFINFNTTRGFERRKVLDALKEFELIDERFFFPAPGCRDDIKSMDDFTYCLWCFEMRKK